MFAVSAGCFVFIGVCWLVSVVVRRGGRQGRQRKRWEDNIREWAGLEFA